MTLTCPCCGARDVGYSTAAKINHVCALCGCIWNQQCRASQAGAAPCPYVVTSSGGTSHCRLAEADARDAEHQEAKTLGALRLPLVMGELRGEEAEPLLRQTIAAIDARLDQIEMGGTDGSA